MKKWFLFFALFICACLAFLYYSIFVSPAFSHHGGDFDFIIHKDASREEVVDSLIHYGLSKPFWFNLLSDRMNYKSSNLKPGLYSIDPHYVLPDLIRHLRSGNQKPVKVTFNALRLLPELAGRITQNIDIDSATYASYLDSLQEVEGPALMTYYIPNTYNVFFNISPEALHLRMVNESKSFWSRKDRMKKAEDLGLSVKQVYTLASIVEQESTLQSEKPDIASVYLNRLKRGMKLQADPTVVYAVGDFSIRRVLNKHLALDSPYNTYMYTGLPPGPICMPSVSSIDAVLNPSDTDYIFFCAKPGYQNGHAFAKDLRGHMRNARTYQAWLREEGIR